MMTDFLSDVNLRSNAEAHVSTCSRRGFLLQCHFILIYRSDFMRLAILADIHGNIHALEAVAARLEQLQPDAVVVAGDIINAVPFSNEVVALIQKQHWLAIRGNHEFYYLDYAGNRAPADWEDPVRWGQVHWLMEHISPETCRYLAGLPDELTLHFPGTELVRVMHGAPAQIRFGTSNHMPEEKIAAAIQSVEQQTMITAHSHMQVDRIVKEPVNSDTEKSSDPLFELSEAQTLTQRVWHVINPGSTGLPLNGDVRAQFAVLDSVSPDKIPGGWRASHHRVPYDRRPALAAYASSGMLARGGVISQLFYWELVTAEKEIVYFYRWQRANLPPNKLSLDEEFAAYKEATGREAYVRAKDPLRTR